MTDETTPELFVARDRARRFHRRIKDAHSERRLSYRGAEVGMETLVDRADKDLASVLEDIRTTVADLEARRIRDRERGYMEMPLVVMAEGVGERVERARHIERLRVGKKTHDARARAAVLVLLEDALARIDTFCVAYDEKRPIGPAALTDLGRLIEHVERDIGFVAAPTPGEAPRSPYDRTPPSIRTDVTVFEDLLRAARAAAPDASTWRIKKAKPGTPLTLSVGLGEDLVRVDSPERLAHVLAVLSHMQPVEARCLAEPLGETEDATGLLSEPAAATADGLRKIRAVEVLVADDAAGRLETVLGGCAGADAALGPDAEKALRALLDAPPLTDGPPPPQRAVAWMALLRAVDSELARALLARAKTPVCRVQASQVPREKTRKAPVRRDLLAALEQAFTDFPTQRVGDVARRVADGKLSAKLPPIDAAALLAVIGRNWRFGGQDRRRAMDLEPLTNADVEELMQDLADHARVRKALETGQTVSAAEATRLERASIAILGRLGRLGR